MKGWRTGVALKHLEYRKNRSTSIGQKMLRTLKFKFSFMIMLSYIMYIPKNKIGKFSEI